MFCFVSEPLNGNSRKNVLSHESLRVKDFDKNMRGGGQYCESCYPLGITEGSFFHQMRP